MNKIKNIATWLCVAALAGCGGGSSSVQTSPVEDYALSAERLGTMQVDGCDVTVNYVHVTHPEHREFRNSFTLATATCPTATVTSNQYDCGKGCQSQTMQLERTTPAENKEHAAPKKEIVLAPKPPATADAELARLKAENASLKKVVGTLVEVKQ